jgi:hypothetical protein
MDQLTNNLHLILLVLLLVLVVIYRDFILIKLPVLNYLLKDQISFILVILVCLLVLVLDIPSGILLSAIIITLGLSIKSKNRFENIPLDINFRSDSEFMYNHKFIPNGNLPPFQSVHTSEKGLIPINSNEASSKSCLVPDFITRVNPINRDGYDVVGCRYDFKDSPQNLTIYGPPLDQCNTYTNTSFSCNGSVFYPLHE